MAALADPAISALAELVKSKRPPGVRLATAKTILDRCGHGLYRQRLQVEDPSNPLTAALESIWNKIEAKKAKQLPADVEVTPQIPPNGESEEAGPYSGKKKAK